MNYLLPLYRCTRLQVRDLVDRARKSEAHVLELRLGMAMRALNLAENESTSQMKHFEQEAKRYAQAQRTDDAQLLQVGNSA